MQQPAAAAPPPAQQIDFASQLQQAGAGMCAPQVNTLAGEAMASTTAYNTASHWSNTAPANRLVSVFIGQKFASKNVPYGATGVIAAPNGQGGCDGITVQVVPSPLSCDKLKETIAARGRQIADLAGIPLMEDTSGQSMLVATAANSCVLVSLKQAYAK